MSDNQGSTSDAHAIRRIGLIVPSSNTTVETELPLLLGRHSDARFSFHGSRLRMCTVSRAELRNMNAQANRCIDEVADAGIDAVLYACLVAVMLQGRDAHLRVETDLRHGLVSAGSQAVAVSSAGALLNAFRALNATRAALVMPYTRPLAQDVVSYVESSGVAVTDWLALEVADYREVGCISGDEVMAAASKLDLRQTDVLVLSACVQMPSLDLVEKAEETFGLPVVTASTAAAFTLLRQLDLAPQIPDAGVLLRPSSASKPSTNSALKVDERLIKEK